MHPEEKRFYLDTLILVGSVLLVSAASVDGARTAAILVYLEKNAGRRSPPPDARAPRITGTDWFAREHRKVPPATWTSPKVKSPANCAACHTQAEVGDYRESNIRLPR